MTSVFCNTREFNFVYTVKLSPSKKDDVIFDMVLKPVLDKIKDSDLVIVSMLIRIKMDKGQSTIDDSHNELLSEIKKLNINLSQRPEELSNEMFYKIALQYEKLFD